ncbi:MAG TPA: hypothetical protein VNQ90_01835 [Chthoniobacteraceae bacterium]|nr:hypothetical protein [Chthoniobacteraceae bacterium]
MIKIIPLAVVSLFFIHLQAGGLHAATLVTASQQKPVENVFLSIENSSTSTTGVVAQNATRPSPLNAVINTQGQTFSIAEATLLKTVVFRLPPTVTIRDIVLETEVELIFYKLENADSTEPTQEITRFSWMMPATLAANDYLYFDLETPFSLAAEQQYGIVFAFKETRLNQSLNLMAGTTYTGGDRISYVVNADGSGWLTPAQGKSNGSLSLHLVAIPEPGSVALLLGAALPLALLGLRHRGRFHRSL